MILARSVAAALLVAGLLVASCSAPLRTDDTVLGMTEGLDTAAPGLALEASAVGQDGGIVLELRAALAPADIAFVLVDSLYVGVVDLAFAVRDLHGREVLAADAVRDTLRATSRTDTRADEPRGYSRRLAVPPGRAVAEVALRGEDGAAIAVRRTEVRMPAPDDRPWLSEPRIARGDEWVVGWQTPRWLWQDAMRVHAELVGGDTLPEFAVHPVTADTAAATPPYWMAAMRGSLAYRGAQFDDGVGEAVWSDRANEIADLPVLDEGVYLVGVRSIAFQDLSTARPLAVLSPTHPRVEDLDELIDALTYIAFPAEIELIREGRSAIERRERFDAFWGSLLAERRVAELIMRRYFERVEEANRRFTSHKPGWKTDRGMVYIILGPPEIVDRTPEAETWHYAFGQNDGARTYTFERVPYYGAPWPIEHHVLARAARYETTWQHAVRRWRSGQVP